MEIIFSKSFLFICQVFMPALPRSYKMHLGDEESPKITNMVFAYIFTDSLNVLYLLNTQTKHPTPHNSHSNQVTIASMVQLFQNRIQSMTIYKVRAHINIDGNKKSR